jgi:hypothetical protein
MIRIELIVAILAFVVAICFLPNDFPKAMKGGNESDNTYPHARKQLLLDFKNIVVEIPKRCSALNAEFGSPTASATIECDGKIETHTFNVSPKLESISFVQNEQLESTSISGYELTGSK